MSSFMYVNTQAMAALRGGVASHEATALAISILEVGVVSWLVRARNYS